MTQRAEAERAIERWLAAPAPTPLGDWAVEWLDPPPEVGAARVAGRVVLFPMPGEPATTEIAWHLHPDSWGHGLATEAARRVLDHGFSHGLGAATALTHLDHAASQRVCQRLGMTELGAEPTTYGVSMCRFVAEPGPGQRVAVPST